MQEQAEVIYAACGGDIEALTGYAEAFEADSRAEHARRAWEHVRVLAAVNGKSELAAEAAARAETLRRRPAGATPLTPREREVVRLVASGHSSAAIAKALFLSVRTVDTHIGRAMRKAGVRSRRDLQHL
ncbi:MAG: hypothetical protein B7X41_15600 [Microbacterium sp. 14-71-5]|nr:MAG: hypothetical protein B7X41_15600 [Microbacterium sp. 14-71-5]